MEAITYKLDRGFYDKLEDFTAVIIDAADYLLGRSVEQFMQWIERRGIERLRSRDEYIIEMIMAGLYWNIYAANAMMLPRRYYYIFKYLYRVRTDYIKLKPAADKVRGYLASHILTKKTKDRVEANSNNFSQLVDWLEAACEFKQEVFRLRQWEHFMNELPAADSSEIIRKAIEFARIYKVESKRCLGSYTANVGNFLKTAPQYYQKREDYIFCNRHEEEYHLNMAAAQVMNTALRQAFDKTEKKVLLLPTCMRKNKDCKAEPYNGNYICRRCNKNCNIYKTAAGLDQTEAEIYLIEHSSSFSTILKQWENKPEYGLIGVACVLNLITGGYEMKGFNIASQCIFLEGCGCRKHWHQEGVVTDIDRLKLESVLLRLPETGN